MSNKKVRLLRPLNGQEVGTESVYSAADAERLAGYGSVEILGDAADEADASSQEPGAGLPAPKAKRAPARKAATGRRATAAKPSTRRR